MIIFLWYLLSITFAASYAYYLKQRKVLEFRCWLRSDHIAHNWQCVSTLYHNIDAFAVAKKEREQLPYADLAFTYGEISFLSLAIMLEIVEPTEEDMFIDLGSGSGKAVIATALLFPIKQAIGIEYLPGLHAISQNIQNTLKKSKQLCHQQAAVRVQFILGDFLIADWSKMTIVLISAAGLWGETWEQLQQKLQQLPKGARVMVISKRLSSDQFELFDARERPMSWGLAFVYIYRKIT